MSEQNPVFTVVGIHKSEGDFEDKKGRTVDYSNTVVTVLKPFSEREIAQGAVGMKTEQYKIKGGQFFHDYQRQKLPCEAELLFHWDFSGKTPRAVLVALKFKGA